MKTIKGLVSVAIVAIILFTSFSVVFAIGFDAEAAYESVFVVFSGNSMGSGFAVTPECIVTNAHVINDQHDVTIEDYSGNSYRAEVYSMDQSADIAVLLVENAAFVYLQSTDIENCKIGDDVYAIGAPNGMAYTLTKGTLSAKERVLERETYIQIDAAINSGNSGGPLLDDNGMVLGMNTMKISDSEGIGFAIPINRILDYLNESGVLMGSAGDSDEAMAAENVPVEKAQESHDTDEAPLEEEDSHVVPSREEGKKSVSTPVLLGITVFSLALNVVLIILLCRKGKNKMKQNNVVLYDASERTDFEIEILD